MVDKLRELINFQSYSGKEKLILEYIKTRLEDAGLQPFFQGDNLVVKLKGEDPKRAFIFNGHVDVVGAGNIAKWKHNPWSGAVINGRIFGRGASDMKGGVLAMMETAESLNSQKLPTDVWFTFVVREETDGEGTKQFAQWFEKEGYINQYSELAAVFAEPTNLDTVKYGHRGHFFIKAEKTGTAGHSSRPLAIKSHAIAEMNDFINDLKKENLSWQKQFSDLKFAPPTITPTAIEAKSDSPNKTADYCQATLDLRTIPDYHEKAFDRVKQMASKRGIKLSLLHPPGPTGYTNPDAKIVKLFQNVVPGVKMAINDASNDLGFFTSLGIDSVIFGPGDMSQAHSTDESADISQVSAAPNILEKVYFAWAKD